MAGFVHSAVSPAWSARLDLRRLPSGKLGPGGRRQGPVRRLGSSEQFAPCYHFGSASATRLALEKFSLPYQRVRTRCRESRSVLAVFPTGRFRNAAVYFAKSHVEQPTPQWSR